MAWGWVFLVIFLIALAYGAWAAWLYFSAKRQGLPPPPAKAYVPFLKSNQNTNYPTPRSSGPFEWVKDQFARLRSGRSARGAYEEAGAGAGGDGGGLRPGRRGRGLEDDAWDTSVGNEDPYGAGSGLGGHYNEEQELGLAPTPGYANESYGRGDYLSQSTGYPGGSATGGERGRDLGGHAGGSENPFGDENQAPSLRSVSPRPVIDTSKVHRKDNDSIGSAGDSPNSVRKSVFQERI